MHGSRVYVGLALGDADVDRLTDDDPEELPEVVEECDDDGLLEPEPETDTLRLSDEL